MDLVDLVDEHEAAAFLGLASGTLSNWRWRKQGPRFVRVAGNRIRYRVEDLRKFVNDRVIEPIPSHD